MQPLLQDLLNLNSKFVANLIMQNSTKLFIGLQTVVSLTAMGCGGEKYPAVSGKVTAAGAPVPSIRVTFAPQAARDNHRPEPFSTGTTDQSGVYTLTTRYGDSGAVVGPHQISFEWAKMESVRWLRFAKNSEVLKAMKRKKPKLKSTSTN